MPPVQLFIILSALVIFPLAWVRGGRPERIVAAVLLAAYLSGPLVQHLNWGRLMVGVAVVDLLVWLVMVWLSLKYDRWWLLLAAAAQTLNLLAHPVLLLNPAADPRDTVFALWIFTLGSLYALLLGVLERHLAGERAVRRRKDDRAKPT